MLLFALPALLLVVPEHSNAATSGAVVIEVESAGEATTICPLDPAKPEEVADDLSGSAVGKCGPIKGNLATLRGVKPGPIILRAYGRLGQGPCYAKQPGGPCTRLRISAGKTLRIQWKIPRQVKAEERPGTVRLKPNQLESVSGNPSSAMTLLIERGSDPPRVGKGVIAPPSGKAPAGVFGIATKVQARGGGYRVAIRPATLDEVFKDLSISVHTPLTLLPSAKSRHVAPRMATSGLKGQFKCESEQAPEIEITADLSDFAVDYGFDLDDRYVKFILTAKPELGVAANIAGSEVHCELTKVPRRYFLLSVVPPVVGRIGGAGEADFEGRFGAKFSIRPRIQVGFVHGRGLNRNIFEFNGDDFSIETANPGAEASFFWGFGLDATLGGVAWLEGRLGPRLVASAQGSTGTDGSDLCFELDGQLYRGIRFKADVLVKRWVVKLVDGDFGNWQIYKRCLAGERIVYADTGMYTGRPPGLYITDPEGNAAIPLILASELPGVGGGGFSSVAISRDGSRVAFTWGMPPPPWDLGNCAGVDLYTIKADGTALTKVSDCGFDADISPNGARVVYNRSFGVPGTFPPAARYVIYSVASSGGTGTRVVDLDSEMIEEPEVNDEPDCTWCPPYLRFTDSGGRDPTYSGNRDIVFSADGQVPTGTSSPCPSAQEPESPDPSKSCPDPPYRDRDIYRLASGEITNLTDYGPGSSPTEARSPAAAVDGRVVFMGFPGAPAMGHRLYRATSSNAVLINPSGLTNVEDPALSPNGSQVVFSASGPSGGGIWTMSSSGGDPKLLVPDAVLPSWGGTG